MTTRFARLLAVLLLFVGGATAWAAGLPPLNQKVLNYANSELGYQDGNGECWTLVHHALQAAGARTDGDSRYVFGAPVGGGVYNAIPGDLLQFEGAYFEGLGTFQHHSAIVYSVNGRKITLAQQNVGGDRHAQLGVIDLDKWKSGTIAAYRPQPR